MSYKHPDLDKMVIRHPDADIDLECYLERYTTNLWFVYVNDAQIFELLHDNVIQYIERQYARLCKQEAESDALDYAIYNYELKKEMS